MEQTKQKDWTEHIWKISKAGAILALISIFTPATGVMESGLTFFLWYFGFWFASAGGDVEIGFVNDFFAPGYDNKYLMIGGVVMVILAITSGLLIAASNKIQKEREFKVGAGMSLFGGILAFIGPAAYYFYIDSEFTGYWAGFDPSFGVILAILAGVVGVIGGIAAWYAFSLESKAFILEKTLYKPTQDKIAMETENIVQSQEEHPNFCKNCGAKLIGPFCQECGAKAEF